MAFPLPNDIVDSVSRALSEDIGSGDMTAALIPPDVESRAQVISREQAVFCGRDWVDEVFRRLDTRVAITWHVEDGAALVADQVLCALAGPARALLSGERTALNFLQTLSGTATKTRRYVDAVAGTRVKILDTRKTLPGLRAAQKYAVRCGGGHNHRMGLYDAILIKENHIHAAGSIAAAVAQAKQAKVPVEIEVEDLGQLQAALNSGVDRVLLDNFTAAAVREAVAMTQRRAELEVSGGITLANIREFAESGVDFISIGDLTKSVQATDLSMRFL